MSAGYLHKELHVAPGGVHGHVGIKVGARHAEELWLEDVAALAIVQEFALVQPHVLVCDPVQVGKKRHRGAQIV